MKFTGKNFQPWASFSLDIDKLTVLVGPSNLGKSSLFRALRGLFRNELPSEFVRNKQDDPLELTLEMDGHTYKATRSKKGSTKYVIDGDEKNPYTSLGGKVPEPLQKLNMGEVHVGDFSIDPIFAEQNKSQFLIDSDRYKPTELNAILGAFSSTEKLDTGKKEANARISQKNSEAKALAVEVRDAEARKVELAKISTDIRVQAVAVESLEKEIQTTEIQQEWTVALVGVRKKLLPIKSILKSLVVPDLTEAERIVRQVAHLGTAVDSLKYSRWLKKTSATLGTIPDKWSETVRIYKQFRAVSDLVSTLAETRVTDLEACGSRLDDTVREIEDGLVEVVNLKGRVVSATQVMFLRGRIQTLQEQRGETETELEAVKSEVQSYQDALIEQQAAEKAKAMLCEKCGRPLKHVCS